jgi:hypothetical protein
VPHPTLKAPNEVTVSATIKIFCVKSFFNRDLTAPYSIKITAFTAGFGM